MKRNLLEIVQEILSDMDSDEVNSIDDTVESEQVATIVKSTYFSMMTTRNWPHTRKKIDLVAAESASRPTHLKVGDSVKEICFIKYNKAKLGETRRKYEDVKYLEPDQFIHKTNQENSDESTVDIIEDLSGVELLIRNDRAPTYYTSFDDEYVVFDSYDSQIGATLVTTSVQSLAYVIPSWTDDDAFIPDLPELAFPALIEEAKAKASYKLAKAVDEKAEQEAGRQNRWLARNARKVGGGIKYPDYGRKV